LADFHYFLSVALISIWSTLSCHWRNRACCTCAGNFVACHTNVKEGVYGLREHGSSLCPDQLWGPPSLLSNGYWGSISLGKSRPGRDANHSPHL